MSEWEKGYVAGRAQAFAEMQQTVDRGMRESGADGGEAPESREEVSPVVRGGPGSGTAVPAPLSAPDASDDVREGQCPECRWTGGLHASGCSAVDAGADVCPHGGGPHFWVQGKASQGIICNRCETRRPADDVSAEPFSPEEEARDQLYLRLKGAREKLCVAQTLIGEVGEWATGREELQEALDRIDAVGARLCPKQWSRFDAKEALASGASAGADAWKLTALHFLNEYICDLHDHGCSCEVCKFVAHDSNGAEA